MSDGLQENPVDWFVEPFFPDGAVDWTAARTWVGQMHTALSKALGSTVWTDAHAAWLGRFAHDTLRFQGVNLTEASTEDLEDLLFTLQPAQADTAPGAPDVAVDALRMFFTFGLEHHGAVAARTALEWLDDGDRDLQFVASMNPGTLTRKQRRALLQPSSTKGAAKARSKRAVPKRKKGKRKKR